MDPEEERVWYLSRIGREKIFKYGTYTVMHDRAITQEHPFYVVRDDMAQTGPVSYVAPGQPIPGTEGSTTEAAPAATATATATEAAPPPPPTEEDAAALAAQMISSNFKVGLSQEEVDALLGSI